MSCHCLTKRLIGTFAVSYELKRKRLKLVDGRGRLLS